MNFNENQLLKRALFGTILIFGSVLNYHRFFCWAKLSNSQPSSKRIALHPSILSNQSKYIVFEAGKENEQIYTPHLVCYYNIKQIMSSNSRYAYISMKTRQNLIELVQKQGLSIIKAGKRLGIKCSTAKLIVKRFKMTGRFFMKKKERDLEKSEEFQTSHQEREIPTLNDENSTMLPFSGLTSFLYYPDIYFPFYIILSP